MANGMGRKDYTLSEDQNIVFNDNVRLAYYTANKWFPKLQDNQRTLYDREDLITLCLLGLVKAIKSYNKDKDTKLATYATRVMNNEVMMALRKERSAYTEYLEDLASNVGDSYYDMVSERSKDPLTDEIVIERESSVERSVALLKTYISMKEGPSKKIVSIYLQNPFLTQRDLVGRTGVGISQSYVSRVIKKFQNRVIKNYYRGIKSG